MKIVPLNSVKPRELTDCWNRCYPSKFALTPDIIERNILHHPLSIQELSLALIEEERQLDVQSFICLKNSAHNRLFPGAHPDQRHLSAVAFKTETCMNILWDYVGQIDASQRSNLVLGQDHGHLLPGIPIEAPHVKNWLISNQWEVSGDKEFDLERDLTGFRVSAFARSALQNANAQVRPATPADDRALEDFFSETFPGRWQFDTLNLKCRSQQEWSDVFLLVIGKRVHGFAYTQSSHSTKEPVAGCVWHTSLGTNWGGLGPIGISKDVRGLGLGGALLEVALSELGQAGVRNCIIDWTTLAEFYGKYGFRVTRTYEKAIYGMV